LRGARTATAPIESLEIRSLASLLSRATALRERFFACGETALPAPPALRSTYPTGAGGSPSAPPCPAAQEGGRPRLGRLSGPAAVVTHDLGGDCAPMMEILTHVIS